MSAYRSKPGESEVVELRPGSRSDAFGVALAAAFGVVFGLWTLTQGTRVECHRRAGVLEPCVVSEGSIFGRRSHSEVLPEAGDVFLEKHGSGKNVSYTLSLRVGSYGRPIAHELPPGQGRERLAAELRAFLADPSRPDFDADSGWNNIAFVALGLGAAGLLFSVLLVLRRVRVSVARDHVEIAAFFWPFEAMPRRLPIDDQSRFAVESEGKSHSLVYRDRTEHWAICTASPSLDLGPLNRMLQKRS
ncbi:MAG: hypothetical protein ACXVEE_20490 [Polyangiales bacterium]